MHTVIAALGNEGCDSELALIKAAEKAKSIKRFIPSVWGARYTKE